MQNARLGASPLEHATLPPNTPNLWPEPDDEEVAAIPIIRSTFEHLMLPKEKDDENPPLLAMSPKLMATSDR